jgi:CotS family spore coat protein
MNLWLKPDSEPLIAYQFEVEALTPVGDDAFELRTTTGPVTLRVVERREERLWFAASVAVHLMWRSFDRFLRPIATVDGRPFVTEDGVAIVAFEPIAGREVRPGDPADLKEIARTLASFHVEASGGEPLPGAASRRAWGRWPDRYGSRRNDLLRFKLEATRRVEQSQVDRAFLAEADRLCQMADEAVDLLTGPVYACVAALSAEAKEVALHNVRCRNFLIDERGQAIIRGLERCRYDLAISDLADLLAKAVRKDRPSRGTVFEALQAYLAVKPLSAEELSVLFALLRFPGRVFKILDRCYNYKRAWSEEGVEHKLALELEAFGRQERFVTEASQRLGVMRDDT